MIKLEAATLTHPGQEREINEDRVWAQIYTPSEGEPTGLFIVCDGVGGYLGGEYASQWAVETIKHELSNLFYSSDPRATLRLPEKELEVTQPGKGSATRLSKARMIESQVLQAVEKANEVVYDYTRQKPKQAGNAGTTLTMAVIQGKRAVIANVGDSRTYLLRSGKLRQITKDHSIVASLVASGKIQPEEVFAHPQRNMIYRSLGFKPEVQVDTFLELLQPGDQLLLCTDGLWEMVQDAQVIAQLVEEASHPEQACEQLVEAANRAGGGDNISVVIVRIH